MYKCKWNGLSESQEAQDFKVEEHYDLEYSDLELSEEFLTTIIKYVDDLCDIISNGDPNLVRTLEVNQNLNDAVNCYKNELDVKRQLLEQPNDQEYYNNEAICKNVLSWINHTYY